MTYNRNTNIAFLLGRVSDTGGISRVTSILSKELLQSQAFDKIYILSYHKREKLKYGWSKKLIYVDLLLNRPSMRKGIIKGSNNLIKILNTNNISVLIAAGHNVGPLAIISSWFSKTKVIYWSHSSFKASTNSRYRILNEKFTAIFCKCIVSLTKADEENYIKETQAKMVRQIYNPMDPLLDSSEHFYDLNSKSIISVGRLTHQKNFSLLVDIAKIVLDKHRDYKWHIYGSGEDEKLLQDKIIKNNLQGRLILMGQSNDLYNQYSKYSMMVMTSRYEGFPMTLIEGMACNLPLVSFDIATGPNEIIRNNENGFLVKAFDYEEMGNKISFLIENPTIRMDFSNNNKKFAQDFKIKTIRNKWINLINEILNAK